MGELGTFEAAREFNVSPVTLLQLIAQGRLQAHKDGAGRWRISRKSLEQWNQKRLARRRRKPAAKGEEVAATAAATA